MYSLNNVIIDMTCLWWTCRGSNRGWILSLRNEIQWEPNYWILSFFWFWIWTEDFNFFSFNMMSGDMDPYVLVQYKSQERKSSVARGNWRFTCANWYLITDIYYIHLLTWCFCPPSLYWSPGSMLLGFEDY
jgi:hypothetical protein